MKLLIVGGLGYVGGRLSYHLKLRNPDFEVYISTTRDQYPAWVEDNGLKIVKMDLKDAWSIKDCVSSIEPDVIVHLGGMPQQACKENPELAQQVNVDGTRHLLETAIEHKVETFIFFSTFQVYGSLKGHITENTPVDPQGVYPKTKVEAENIIRNLSDQSDIQTVIFRLSNAMGAPQDNEVAQTVWTLVFNAFCKAAVRDGKISVRSNQYRDFIAMPDVLNAVEKVIMAMGLDIDNQVFNLGGKCCLSIEEVAHRVAKVYKENFNVKDFPIEPAKEDASYEPFEYDIEELEGFGVWLDSDIDGEILRTLEFCKEHMTETV